MDSAVEQGPGSSTRSDSMDEMSEVTSANTETPGPGLKIQAKLRVGAKYLTSRMNFHISSKLFFSITKEFESSMVGKTNH